MHTLVDSVKHLYSYSTSRVVVAARVEVALNESYA